MGKSKIEIIQQELDSKMSFEMMKDLTKEEYLDTVKKLLYCINNYRKEGLSRLDMVRILNNVYYTKADEIENNEIYGSRFETLHDELFGHCDGLYFWEDDFDLYITKWDDESFIKYIK